jgi:hypothetical protein
LYTFSCNFFVIYIGTCLDVGENILIFFLCNKLFDTACRGVGSEDELVKDDILGEVSRQRRYVNCIDKFSRFYLFDILVFSIQMLSLSWKLMNVQVLEDHIQHPDPLVSSLEEIKNR